MSVSATLSLKEAFGQSVRVCIGLHNKCFLSSVIDVGTYIDIPEGKKYLYDEGLYIPIGGETYKPRNIELSDCAKT